MATVCDTCRRTSTLDEAFHVLRITRKRTRRRCPGCFGRAMLRYALWSAIFAALLGMLGLTMIHVGVGSDSPWIFFAYAVYTAAMAALTFTHEAGHALAAALVGFRLFTVSIGSQGRVLAGIRAFKCDFVLRSLLTGGSVLAYPKSTTLARCRMLIFVLGGPLCDVLVLVGSIYLLIDRAAEDLYTWAVAAVAIAAFVQLINGLYPRHIWIDGGLQPNDGLILLGLARTERADVEKWPAYRLYLEGLESLEQKKPDEAIAWFERGMREYPAHQLAESGIGLAHLAAGRYDLARASFVKSLAIEKLQPQEEALLWNNLAWTNLMIADPELLDEADRMSQQAYERIPWFPSVRGTRGSVLVELGRLDEGLEFLHGALADNDDQREQALNACWIAAARHRQGDTADAERFLRQARKLDPTCPLIERVARGIASPASVATV